MKTILTSILAGSLLATFAVAQSSRSAAFDKRAHEAAGHNKLDKDDASAYVITVGFQFGTVDLRTGEFVPISVSPSLAELGIGDGLIQGPGRSLLSLAFSGDLYKIDPFTGEVSLVGKTGLADCSLPGSYAPNCANFIGRLNESYYVTDFANNLYSLDPRTGAAKLIGPTDVPPLTFAPFSENPDGSFNVYAESLFSVHGNGKLYALFSTTAVNFETGINTPLIPAAIYQIDHATGKTTLVTLTDHGLSSIVNVNDGIYAFDAFEGQVVSLNLKDGQTKVISAVHGPACDAGPPSCVIAGATAAPPLGDGHH
jgi:outer membrane protein assembly factor BamB